jgi:hypothetical protein
VALGLQRGYIAAILLASHPAGVLFPKRVILFVIKCFLWATNKFGFLF